MVWLGARFALLRQFTSQSRTILESDSYRNFRWRGVAQFHHLLWNQPVIPRVKLVNVFIFTDLNVSVHGAELLVIANDVVDRPGSFLRLGDVPRPHAAAHL